MYIARLCEGRPVKYGTLNLLWHVYILWMINYLTNKHFMTAYKIEDGFIRSFMYRSGRIIPC